MDERSQVTVPGAWMPVFFWLGVIAVESTAAMSGANTDRWLLALCHALWRQTDGPSFEMAHHLLRKAGHFCGYGTLSVLFFRAWFATVGTFWKGTVRGLLLEAAGLAVSCTFVIACMDELHQSFLVGRTSSFYDVLIDTAGAIVFIAVLLRLIARRKRMRFKSALA